MTPEVKKRFQNAHQWGERLSGMARKLTQMRVKIWYPDQFDGPGQAAAAGKLFAYCENIPVGGKRGSLHARRDLVTGEFLAEVGYTPEQVKQAYFAELERVQSLLAKR